MVDEDKDMDESTKKLQALESVMIALVQGEDPQPEDLKLIPEKELAELTEEIDKMKSDKVQISIPS